MGHLATSALLPLLVMTLSTCVLGLQTSGVDGVAAPKSEPEPEIEFPDNSPEIAPEERPSMTAITVPPFTLVAIILAGIIVLYLQNRKRKQDSYKRVKEHDQETKFGEEPIQEEQDIFDRFFSKRDTDLIADLRSFFNQPGALLQVSFPAIASLSFCPLVLYMYNPFINFFWPDNETTGIPIINDAIACFLAPAGFIYALTFAFCFQSAMGKQRFLLQIISQETALLDQIMIITSHLRVPVPVKARVYKAMKADVFSIGLQIQEKRGYSSQDFIGVEASGQIWTCLKELETEVSKLELDWSTDYVMYEKIVTLLTQLNLAASERIETQDARIKPLKWIFLELLGFFSFFGILLIRTWSEKLDLTICVITVLSITILCYVIADMDSPFSGFLRVDVSSLADILEKARFMYDHSKLGHDVQLPCMDISDKVNQETESTQL